MIVDKDTKLFKRIVDSLDTLLQPFQHAAKTMILDQKQQFFFRLAVMIKPRETDSGSARDVAHRSRVITLFRKDARGGAQDQFELLIVTGKILIYARGHCFAAGSAGILTAMSAKARTIRPNAPTSDETT